MGGCWLLLLLLLLMLPPPAAAAAAAALLLLFAALVDIRLSLQAKLKVAAGAAAAVAEALSTQSSIISNSPMMDECLTAKVQQRTVVAGTSNELNLHFA